MTLVEMLEKNAGEIPEKAAIIFHNTSISYIEFNNMVNRLANGMLDRGLKKGDKVGLMLPRIPELVISFLAVAKARGIVVPINFELQREGIQTILNNTSPRFLIVYSQFLNLAKKSLPVDFQIPVIEVGNEVTEHLQWNEVGKYRKAYGPWPEIKDDDVVYLNYTSGSTGKSKGAVTTHSNIYWNTVASVDALGLTPDDVHLCLFAPFAHPHEIFSRPLFLGGTMVIVDKIFPRSIAEAISKHRVTSMMGLAPVYENLLELLKHKTYDLSSLRVPESGGMYTRLELIERFRKKLGASIIPVWGSTETTGIAIANRPGNSMKAGSVGKPCLSYEVKIIDDHGNDLPPGEIGEMVFKGPAVVQSYYENTTKQQDSCFRDGWYYSGDLGRIDEDGNFYFVERKTGMLKVAGLKVYPMEIEQVLMDHSDIKEAAVISVKDRLRGEVPKAIIVTVNGNGLTGREVVMFCKKRLSNYKLPKMVEIRDSLPKNGSGKVNKKALQKEYV